MAKFRNITKSKSRGMKNRPMGMGSSRPIVRMQGQERMSVEQRQNGMGAGISKQSSSDSAREMFRQRYPDGSKNFMTPKVQRYGKINSDTAYEISSGKFENKEIYGVTIIKRDSEGKIVSDHEKSKSFTSKEMANAYVESLKDDSSSEKSNKEKLNDESMKELTGETDSEYSKRFESKPIKARKFQKVDELAKVYAEGQKEGSARDGRIFIDGDTIYSYGYHFPIAKRVNATTYEMNTKKYSNTTTKQQSAVRRELEAKGYTIVDKDL